MYKLVINNERGLKMIKLKSVLREKSISAKIIEESGILQTKEYWNKVKKEYKNRNNLHLTRQWIEFNLFKNMMH